VPEAGRGWCSALRVGDPLRVPEERVVGQPLTGVLHRAAPTGSRRRFGLVVGEPGSRRRRWAWIVAAIVLVLSGGGLTTGLTLHHMDDQYGPIERGPFAGPLNPDRVRGGVAHERFIIKPGGTVQYLESLANRGSHSVKITSIDTDQLVTAIRWSVWRLVPGGSVSGADTPWQRFPAIVPGHYGVIRLLITIRRPADCSKALHGPDGAVYYDGFHVVHWDSLLSSHSTTIGDNFAEHIRVC
jgi:hypothetical protein